MKFSDCEMYRNLLVGYVVFWMGLCVGDVGTVPAHTVEVYTWNLPFTMAILMAPLIYLSYMMGKESKELDE